MSELNAISQVTQIAQMTENKLSFTFEDEGEQKSRSQDNHRYKRHNYCCRCQFGADKDDEDTIIEKVRWHEKKSAKLKVCELVLPKLIERYGTLEELREQNKKNKQALYEQKKLSKYGGQTWQGRGGYNQGGYNNRGGYNQRGRGFGGPMRGGYNNRGRGGFQPYQRGGRGGGYHQRGGYNQYNRGGYNQGYNQGGQGWNNQQGDYNQSGQGWNNQQGDSYGFGGNWNQGDNQDSSGFGGSWKGPDSGSAGAPPGAPTPGASSYDNGVAARGWSAPTPTQASPASGPPASTPVTTPVGATDGYIDFSAD